MYKSVSYFFTIKHVPSHFVVNMESAQPPKDLLDRPFARSRLWGLIWVAIYFATLGFAPKYRERLRLFEFLDPGNSRVDYKRYTEPASFLGCPYIYCDDECGEKEDNSLLHAEGNTTTINSQKIVHRSQSSRQPRLHFKRDKTGDSVRAKQVVSLISFRNKHSQKYPPSMLLFYCL